MTRRADSLRRRRASVKSAATTRNDGRPWRNFADFRTAPREASVPQRGGGGVWHSPKTRSKLPCSGSFCALARAAASLAAHYKSRPVRSAPGTAPANGPANPHPNRRRSRAYSATRGRGVTSAICRSPRRRIVLSCVRRRGSEAELSSAVTNLGVEPSRHRGELVILGLGWCFRTAAAARHPSPLLHFARRRPARVLPGSDRSTGDRAARSPSPGNRR